MMGVGRFPEHKTECSPLLWDLLLWSSLGWAMGNGLLTFNSFLLWAFKLLAYLRLETLDIWSVFSFHPKMLDLNEWRNGFCFLFCLFVFWFIFLNTKPFPKYCYCCIKFQKLLFQNPDQEIIFFWEVPLLKWPFVVGIEKPSWYCFKENYWKELKVKGSRGQSTGHIVLFPFHLKRNKKRTT